jgi:transposase
VLASAFVASVADPAIFKSGRDLAAWIGLVPRQNSSGGKERLGGITKVGNGYLRQMVVVAVSTPSSTVIARSRSLHRRRVGVQRPRSIPNCLATDFGLILL